MRSKCISISKVHSVSFITCVENLLVVNQRPSVVRALPHHAEERLRARVRLGGPLAALLVLLDLGLGLGLGLGLLLVLVLRGRRLRG